MVLGQHLRANLACRLRGKRVAAPGFERHHSMATSAVNAGHPEAEAI